MKRIHILSTAFACLTAILLTAPATNAEQAEEKAKDILNATGVKGGVIVHIGCGDSRLTAALRANDSFLVHGLDTDGIDIAKARVYLRAKNLYGQVSVAKYDSRTLPYRDNLVNLIVADTLGNVPTQEALRVLTPLSVMIVGGNRSW